ncbi:MAG: MmgE/PrpD family protein [Pseudomonadota bacterium]
MSGQIKASSLTEELVDILSRSVDGETRRRAALHVLDWLGCAAAGAPAEAVRTLAKISAEEDAGPCSVIGGGAAGALAAVLPNGAAGGVLEMDDVHGTAILHPGPVVIPAALAAAQHAGADGAAFLDGVVRGVEAMVRIGAAVGPGHYAHWHNTATCGPFGAAAAAASVFGLSGEESVWALGNAGTQSSGLWAVRHEPVMSKQLHGGRAAHAGLLAAMLAQQGFTGPRFVLEGPQGFFEAMCPDGAPKDILKDPEGPWRIFEVSFKPWPACRHAHAAIDAALALRPRVDSAAIEAIDILTYADAVKFCDTPQPETVLQAKFSLQHSVAAALADGPPPLAAFDLDYVAKPSVARLREVCRVESAAPYDSAYPDHYGAEVRAHLATGETVSAAAPDALGDPENPLSEAALEDKARALMAAGGMDAVGSDRLIAAALVLGEGGSLEAVIKALPKGAAP